MDNNHDISKSTKSKLWFSKLLVNNRFVSRIKRKFSKNVWVARGILIVSFFIILFLIVFGIVKLLTPTPFATYWGYAKDFLFLPTSNLPSVDNKINIAVLGKGGKGHEAPDLTDTIMFASIDLTRPKVNLIALPRDIWIPSLRAKLNSAYYWGNQKQTGGGLPLAKSTIEEIVGVPVQYAVVIDFSGFEKIIDAMGGIEVEVENSFIDTKYPIPGLEDAECKDEQVQKGQIKQYHCRYETIEFKKGKQIMDGKTALKFVRSRHADGDEGTDLARSRRQQKVIAAMKQKLLSKVILLHPKKALAVYNEVRNSVETDIPDKYLMVLARIALKARNSLTSQVLPEDLLVNPPITAKYDYQYIFVPVDGNWQKVQEWLKNILQ